MSTTLKNRKSRAYHQAKKNALLQGDDIAIAKTKAKAAYAAIV